MLTNRKKERNMATKRKKQKKSKKKKIFIAIEVLLLIILIPVAFFIFKISQIKTYTMDKSVIEENEFHDGNIENYTNIALFGVDSRANELTKNTRTDCIIIASINNKTKDVQLASIYRDTYVYIADHGYTKINHAYAFGGPELALSTINKNFDLNVKDFVTINFSVLSEMIDALGGVDIKITKDERKYVNAYARNVAKINGTEMPPKIKQSGLQTLTGTQATGYCRVRYTAGGDFKRAERQRTVLKQMIKKAKSSNPVTLYKLMDTFIPQVYTSLGTSDILKLSTGILSYNITKNYGFPFDKQTPTIRGASVVTATTLSSNVTKLHKELFGTENYEPSSTVNYRSNEISNSY